MKPMSMRRWVAKQRVLSSVGDLTVRCETVEGKLTYIWGALEVEVTPRALRAGPCSGAPPSAQAWGRETTPQRALRKMKDKAKRVAARAKKGKYPPIVLRTLANVIDRLSRRRSSQEERRKV